MRIRGTIDGVSHSTETHVARSIEILGHEVTRIQEGETRSLDVPALVEDHDLFLWTSTFGLAVSGGTIEDRYSMIRQIDEQGIPTVSAHLDKWWDLPRQAQLEQEPFFRCLTPETRFVGSVSGMTRRCYTGMVVRVTAGEHVLTATPNHPVLTGRGWLALDDLNASDYLVCGVGCEGAAFRSPHIDYIPTVQQIFEAASKTPGLFAGERQRIRGQVMDFHGDGTDGEVDVVGTSNGLPLQINSSFFHPSKELRLSLAGAAHVHRAKPLSHFASVPGSDDSVGFGSRSSDAFFFQNGLNTPYTHTSSSRDAVNSTVCEIRRSDIASYKISRFLSNEISSLPTLSQRALTHQKSVNPSDTEASLLRQFGGGFSGPIGLIKLDRIERLPFSGHVYNLQTQEGAFLAEGIVTHNCRYVFTADGGNQNRFAKLGINHHWMPPGVFEPECFRGTPRDKYRSEIAFVGSWQGGYHPEWEHRAALVSFLMRVYGDRCRFWPRPGEPAVRGQDLADLYASTKVLVGDSCMVGGTFAYHSDRIPETLGRGGFLLHPFVGGVTDGTHYVDGEHLRCWSIGDWDGLRALISHYLEHDDERRQIAQQGQKHVRANHTYTNRVETLISEVLRMESERDRAKAIAH